MKIIHQSLQNIVRPLVSIDNLLLTNGVFPESLKIVNVIPVFKADDATLFSNYRPISIHLAFYKLFEKVVFNRLTEFLNLHNILYSNQFGFRNYHSTALALIDLISNISSAIDRNESTSAGIFLDLSKAFHTIYHKILPNYNTMAFGTLLCRGSKARIGLNLSSLGRPINLTIGKFHVACHRNQSLGLFCSLFS